MMTQHVALCFLRESSARQSFHMVEARDSSADEAFWDSLGKTISDDKLNLWDAAGNTLKQYLSVTHTHTHAHKANAICTQMFCVFRFPVRS